MDSSFLSIDDNRVFRSLFGHMSIGLVICHTDGMFFEVNDSFCEITGYSQTELLEMSFKDITFPEDLYKDLANLKLLLEGKILNYSLEKRYIRKDKSIIWVELNVSIIPDHDNSPKFIIGTIKNITEHKNTEIKLKASADLIVNILDSTNEAFFALDKNLCITRVNKKAAGLMNCEAGSFIGKHILKDFPELIDQEYFHFFTDALTLHKYLSFESGFVDHKRWFECRIYPTDEGLSVFFNEITNRKKAEIELTSVSSRLNDILSAVPDIIMEVNNEKVYTWANHAGYDFFGEDVLGKEASCYFEGSQDTYQAVKELITGNEKIIYIESLQRRKDGEKRLLAWWCRSLTDANGNVTGVLSTARDITDQKNAEEAIRISEDKFVKLFRSSPDAIMLTRISDGLFVEVNDSACRISGYSREELIGNSSIALNFWVNPDERNRYVKELKTNNCVFDFEADFRIRSGEIKKTILSAEIIQLQDSPYILGVIHDITDRKNAEEALSKTKQLYSEMSQIAKIGGWEFDVTTQQGTWTDEVSRIHEIPIGYETSVALGLSFYEGETKVIIENAVKEAIEKGIPYDLELELTTAKGNKKWVRTIAQVVSNNGKVEKVLGSIQDITERVIIRQELVKAKERAEESDRLKSAFLQNMSHEIRTPLNAIMGFSEIMNESFDDKEMLTEFAGIIKQRGDDLLVIINDILDIARIESGQLAVNQENCRLDSLCTEMDMLFTEDRIRQTKKLVDFIVLPDDNIKGISLYLDRSKLKQVLINLIGNAFKFTHAGKVEVGCRILDSDFLSFYVSDTGIGIPADQKTLIFERFMQANKSNTQLYGGTGLGLAIVQGLLNVLGGKIWLQSELGKGSTFHFTFPYSLVENEIVEVIADQEKQPSVKSDLTILIVEDDFFNLKYLREVLSGSGSKILHTEFGRNAVELARNQHIDLVLMDIRLPDISGYDATRLIKQHNPDIQIIAQTAYAMSSDKQKAFESGCDFHISKPIKKVELLRIISDLVSRK